MRSLILFVAGLASLAASAAVPSTIGVGGRLTNAGGAIVDGQYGLTIRVWDDEFGGSPVYSEAFVSVPVTDGIFGLTLGAATPLTAALFSGPRWVEVAVEADPPLTRVPLSSVPFALMAGGLACTACVADTTLDASVAARFVDAAGDTMTGDLDLAGHALRNFRADPYSLEPPPCDAARTGSLSSDATGKLFLCAGGTWQRIATCDATCPAAATVACAAPIRTTCGDSCPGTGILCASGFVCSASGCLPPGSSTSNPGLSCAEIISKSAANGSGLYWLDPDGIGNRPPFQAFCDMVTDGGGWTLVLHTYFSGSNPPTVAFQQNQNEWIQKGIGTPAAYVGISSNAFFVMPLADFAKLAGPANSLRFQSDSVASHSVLQDFDMNAAYSLDGSNEAIVKQELCGNSANCFLDANGFSAVGIDNDNWPQVCSTNSYASIGWWYDDCFSYNPFWMADKQHYSGYSNKDPTTNHWSWWVR